MKNVFLVISAAAILFLSACGKNAGTDINNDTAITTSTADLFTKWYYSSDTVNYYTGSKLDSSKTSAYYTSDYILFNSDGTGSQLRGSTTTAFSYSVLNQVITFMYPNTYKQYAANLLKINGGVGGPTSLVASSTTVAATIRSLSSTDLTLTYNTTVSSSNSITEIAHFTK